MGSLESHLQIELQALKFGTSGRRGLVRAMPQLEIYLNARAEIEYLQGLDRQVGGIVPGEEFFFAADLRPSSVSYMEEFDGNGALAQAVAQAIRDAGMQPVFLGFLPTPALTSFAIARGRGSIMVTGSHIPFDRNGYKTNTSRGELLKCHEEPIGRAVEQMRRRLLEEDFALSRFDEQGLLKGRSLELPPVDDRARIEYLKRYQEFFADDSLKGLRVVCYQHSAVGRDLLVEALGALGAEVLPMGRSESFVPIDTEAIDAACLAGMNQLVAEATAQHGPIDALLSTDGDSDRPLVLGVDSKGVAHFVSGDRLGMVVAGFLGADAVVVPISCNDAIDRGALAAILEPKTRIGSPYVIAGMEVAMAKGKRQVCGWEANGGFLTASEFIRKGHKLSALATRDALLPILSILVHAREEGVGLCELFDRLPQRLSQAALLRQFPRPTAQRILGALSPEQAGIRQAIFTGAGIEARDAQGTLIALTAAGAESLGQIRARLASFFTAGQGFCAIGRIDYTDGVRIYFTNGDVAHIRPSGNADELRIYAVADTAARASAIAAAGVEEPDGILRRMESELGRAQ